MKNQLILSLVVTLAGLSSASAANSKIVCTVNSESATQKEVFDKMLYSSEVFKNGSEAEIIAVLPGGGVLHVPATDWEKAVEPKSLLKDARIVTLQVSKPDQFPNKRSLTIYTGKNIGSERIMDISAAGVAYLHEDGPSSTSSNLDSFTLLDFTQRIMVSCTQKK